MTVNEVIDKINKAHRILENQPVYINGCDNELVDILEDYIYMLGNLLVKR